MDYRNVIKFIFELGQLKRIRHEGWSMIGVDCPETVAAHSLRAAQIAYILAKMEKYHNPYQVVTMIVFHDIGECRIGDLHRVAKRYVKAAEEKAVQDQLNRLPKGWQKELWQLWHDIEKASGRAGQLAKDADLLEQAFTAKELLEKGYNYAQDWINNIRISLKTKSAKKTI